VSGRYVGTGDAALEMSVVVEFAAVPGNPANRLPLGA